VIITVARRTLDPDRVVCFIGGVALVSNLGG